MTFEKVEEEGMKFSKRLNCSEGVEYRERQRHALSSPGQLLPVPLLLLSVGQLLVILDQLVDL